MTLLPSLPLQNTEVVVSVVDLFGFEKMEVSIHISYVYVCTRTVCVYVGAQYVLYLYHSIEHDGTTPL